MNSTCLKPLDKRHDAAKVPICFEARCNDCGHFHKLIGTPLNWTALAEDWRAKHVGHDIEFLSVKRRIPRFFDDRDYEKLGQAPWWLEYKENADIKLAWAVSTTLTVTIASLASSSALTTGRESTAVNATTNKYLDWWVAGRITLGTTPTAGVIRVYLYGSQNDTPTYPVAGADCFTGADSAATIASENIRNALLPLFWETATTTVSDRVHPLHSAGIAAHFGGILPSHWGVFVTHSTVAILNATAGNHRLDATGVFATSI